MKRIIAYLLLAVLLLGALAPAAYATETEAAAEETEAAQETEPQLGGWVDDHFRWKIEDGTLTISGEGVMPGNAPWKSYEDKVRRLVFEGNISTVAGGAFIGFTHLEEIQFSGNLKEIGEYAFQGCTAIRELRLPDTFRKFGSNSFGGCSALTQVYCDGYMPRFETNCLWNDARIYIYYAPDKAWKVKDIKPLEQNFGGRLEVLCQDGTDPIPNGEDEPVPPAPVVETLPPATEETTVPTTEATVATEPVMVTLPPETQAPTVPETTEAVTQPQTEPTQVPTEATEPPIEEQTLKGGFMGLALILGAMTFFIVGALAFKAGSRRKKY